MQVEIVDRPLPRGQDYRMPFIDKDHSGAFRFQNFHLFPDWGIAHAALPPIKPESYTEQLAGYAQKHGLKVSALTLSSSGFPLAVGLERPQARLGFDESGTFQIQGSNDTRVLLYGWQVFSELMLSLGDYVGRGYSYPYAENTQKGYVLRGCYVPGKASLSPRAGSYTTLEQQNLFVKTAQELVKGLENDPRGGMKLNAMSFDMVGVPAYMEIYREDRVYEVDLQHDRRIYLQRQKPKKVLPVIATIAVLANFYNQFFYKGS